MIDTESEPGAWKRELERLGSHGPRIMEDERTTLLETIRRLEDRLVTVESSNTLYRLALEGIRSCSMCEVCRGAAARALNSARR